MLIFTLLIALADPLTNPLPPSISFVGSEAHVAELGAVARKCGYIRPPIVSQSGINMVILALPEGTPRPSGAFACSMRWVTNHQFFQMRPLGSPYVKPQAGL